MEPESIITYITGYSGFIARVLFLIAWGADTYTYIRTEVILRNQTRAGLRAPGLKINSP